MKPVQNIAVLAALLLVAGALQQSLAHRVSEWFRPDFLLVALAAYGLCATRSQGATGGFLAGVVHGGLAGANLTHYAISRCVAGFLTSWSRGLNLGESPWLVGVAGALCTLVAQTALMFLAAPPDIPRYLGATIGTAVVDGALVVPTYAATKRLLAGTNR